MLLWLLGGGWRCRCCWHEFGLRGLLWLLLWYREWDERCSWCLCGRGSRVSIGGCRLLVVAIRLHDG